MNRFVTVTAALMLAATWSAGAAARVLPDFAELVERNHTSVVNISTTKKAEPRREQPPGPEVPELENTPFGDLFRRFFGDREGFPERFNASSMSSQALIVKPGCSAPRRFASSHSTE